MMMMSITEQTCPDTEPWRYNLMTVVVIAGPLVLYKDNNPIPSRFTLMALICATIGVFCLMITSSWCKERVSITVEKREKFNYFEALKHIIKNRALLGLIFSSLAGMIAASVVNGLNTYLFKDYFGNVQIMAVSGMLSTVFHYHFVGTKFVSKNSEKRMAYIPSRFCRYRIRILFFFPIKNPTLFIVINGICYLGASGFQVLIWAMVNDAIDYQELTTGDRKEGMVYATYSFFRKLASAVSSSLSSFTLALIGYNVNEAVQTAAVKAHIWKSYTAIYAIGYLIAVLILYFVYPLSKKKTEEMLETLAKKRAKQGE
ncbi:MAG: MFS transporter [Blautia obeum]